MFHVAHPGRGCSTWHGPGSRRWPCAILPALPRETEEKRGTHDRDRQPEGRGGQDHDRRQPRREPRRRRAAGARGRRRPPGQPDLGPRPQDPREPAEPLRGPHRAASPRGADGRDRPRAPHPRAFGPQPHRGGGRARERPRPGVPAQGGPRPGRRPLRLRPRRLPAEPRPPHRQRAGRRRQRADPDAVRVLRPRGDLGAHSPPCSASSARSTPASRSRGCS